MAKRSFQMIGFEALGIGYPMFARVLASDQNERTYSFSLSCERVRVALDQGNPKFVSFRAGEEFIPNSRHVMFAFSEHDLYIGTWEMLERRLVRRIKSLMLLKTELDERQRDLLVRLALYLKMVCHVTRA